MAHTGVTVLLLFFGLFTSTVFGNGCEFLNVTGNSSSDFNLTVTPETLSDKTNYTVRLGGSGNVTVIFQALAASGPVGNWSAGNVSCNGSSLFLNPFETQTQLEAQWTSSPANVTSVNITAHITTDNGTFIVSKTLSQVATTQTTPVTSIGPNTGNSTANSTASTVTTGTNNASSTVSTGPNTGNSTANSTASTVTTATTPLKTTNATSAVKTSYLTLAFLLLMLSITSNYLL